MALDKEVIKEKVAQFGKNERDTGSVEVQIALLTERINNLSKHFEVHKKDKLTKRHFLKMIGQRRRLLHYLKRTNEESYKKLVQSLGL